MSFRSGYVALVGKPNVGKSTLLNTVVGQKVSIVSDKPQTTRRRLLGIATTDNCQIVFIDTPGLHEAHTQLGKILNDSIREALSNVDLVVVVADASRMPSAEDRAIAKLLESVGWTGSDGRPKLPLVLCLNKMDLLKAADVEAHVEAYSGLFGTDEFVHTCLTKKQNVDKLVAKIQSHLPEADPIYDPDELTDQPMRVMAAEFIREQALARTRQELPHALATVVDLWEEEQRPQGRLTRISASIVVEKQSQKAIIIGRQGSMLKEIGAAARKEIEALLGNQVHLELFVKVREDWRQNPRMLRDLEYLNSN